MCHSLLSHTHEVQEIQIKKEKAMGSQSDPGWGTILIHLPESARSAPPATTSDLGAEEPRLTDPFLRSCWKVRECSHKRKSRCPSKFTLKRTDLILGRPAKFSLLPKDRDHSKRHNKKAHESKALCVPDTTQTELMPSISKLKH